MINAKVMVVDDSPTELKLMSAPFLSQGYDLVTAVDGEEALKKLASEKPDIVVLDVVMPKLNGFKVCRQIKNSAKFKNVKIIPIDMEKQVIVTNSNRCCQIILI